MTWFWIALGAMLFMAFNSMVFTRLEGAGVPSALTISIFKAVASGCMIVGLLWSGIAPDISRDLLLWLLLAGVFSNLGDMGQLFALGNAPNPGYALGIIFTFPVLMAVASWALPVFGAELTTQKLLGMAICISGALILATAKRTAPVSK